MARRLLFASSGHKLRLFCFRFWSGSHAEASALFVDSAGGGDCHCHFARWRRGLVKPLPYYLLLALIIFISNPLLTSRGRTILFYFRDLPVTLEAIAYGALFAMSLLAVLIGFIGYNSIVTPNRFLYLFARFAPRTVFVITVAMRFVPLLKRRIQEIIRVQKSQGYFYIKEEMAAS